MGSSRKHKEKDKKRKRRHHSRSRSRSGSRERKSRRRRVRDEREQEPGDRYDDSSVKREDSEEVHVPSAGGDVSLSIEETNKIRAKLGMKPLEVSSGASAAPLSSVSSEDIPVRSSGGELSLSIEETNKVRAKLGLKPLDVGDGPSGDGDGEDKPQAKEDVHVPAVNMAELKRTEDLRQKMQVMKEKRKIADKLRKVKTLAASDSEEENASAWVKRSRKLEREKEMAEKRAKLLEEMDEEFGIGDLVEEEFKSQTRKDYSAKDLKGLRVEHQLTNFKEGQSVILTLKDKAILDEDGDDVLVNVNLIDQEKADKNVENKKKKPDYKPYDEPEYDEYGMVKSQNILEKYDEEITGAQKTSFQLGSGGRYNAEEEREMERIRTQLRQQGESLNTLNPNIATEFFTPEEMDAKFKKVKKKVRKIRKREVVKAEDLVPLHDSDNMDYGSRQRGRGVIVAEGDPAGEENTEQMAREYAEEMGVTIKQEPVDMDIDRPGPDEAEILGPEEDLTGVVVEEDEASRELDFALSRARRIGQRKNHLAPEKIAIQIKLEPDTETTSLQPQALGDSSGKIILNSTSEFCRNLGEIPTYGLSGNREEDREELMDTELEMMEQRRKQQELEDAASGWNEVDIDNKPVDILGEEKAVLEEEPIVNEGVGAALALAVKKGYLEQENKKKMGAPKHSHLQAQHYSIEDKKYDDLDEKFRKRDRYGGGGVISDFREKNHYKPDVKLEYVDDTGRMLSQKEAFRQLSHRFHGKGSGKKKTEKRMKKLEEQQLMKQMSSTDTPLNTLALLQEKQKVEKSPFIVLSGSKGMSSASIMKPL